MASGTRKTTMAKLNRERKLREKRMEKAAKKQARKEAAAANRDPYGDVPAGAEVGQPDEVPGGSTLS